MSPEEILEYRAAIGLWIEFHGSVSPLVSDEDIWQFYYSSQQS